MVGKPAHMRTSASFMPTITVRDAFTVLSSSTTGEVSAGTVHEPRSPKAAIAKYLNVIIARVSLRC